MVNIGIPSVFLVIRLLAHAFAPKSYGPAGGYTIFTVLVAGVLYIFGFIVAATLGCTAGSVDLTEGMFRHLVVTGRSRLALYLARIPAGLAIIVPLVAIGYTIVCAVCVFAAPTCIDTTTVQRARRPVARRLRELGRDHAEPVICFFPSTGHVPAECPVPRPGLRWSKSAGTPASPPPRHQLEALAVQIAGQDYPATPGFPVTRRTP